MNLFKFTTEFSATAKNMETRQQENETLLLNDEQVIETEVDASGDAVVHFNHSLENLFTNKE
jgi:hypothetical protein